MSLDDLIQKIVIFCEEMTPKIITELQVRRFENDGAFNDNEEWQGNSPKVIKDKGYDTPLQDSGALRNSLENPDNWDLKPKFSDNTLTLTIPDTEEFTDSKYDVLQTGGKVDPYISPRGNKINITMVPARNFKDLSRQDIEWITEQLISAIKKEFA
jgi:hypothetical protein